MPLVKLWPLPFTTEITFPARLRVTSPARVTTISVLALIGLIVYFRRWREKRKEKSQKDADRERNEASQKPTYLYSPNGGIH